MLGRLRHEVSSMLDHVRSPTFGTSLAPAFMAGKYLLAPCPVHCRLYCTIQYLGCLTDLEF